MAYENRAYTADYSAFVREQTPRQPLWDAPPERVKRTREKPQIHTEPESKPKQAGGLTGQALTRYIVLLVFAGALLIATIFLTAMATDIKYSINRITKENVTLENDIAMLSVKLETANSIESIEEYATKELNMRYPTENQCIYFDESTPIPENLAETIRGKVYSTGTAPAE